MECRTSSHTGHMYTSAYEYYNAQMRSREPHSISWSSLPISYSSYPESSSYATGTGYSSTTGYSTMPYNHGYSISQYPYTYNDCVVAKKENKLLLLLD